MGELRYEALYIPLIVRKYKEESMRSDLMKKGLERAPHRSLFKAMGYTDEEIAQPLDRRGEFRQ